jgi:hypothetical protein
MRKATFAVALTAWLIGVVALAFFGPVVITGIVVLMWRPAALLGFAVVALTLVAAFAGLPFAAMLTSGRSPRVALALSVLGLLAALVLAAASFAVAEVLPAMSASHHDDPGPPPELHAARSEHRCDGLPMRQPGWVPDHPVPRRLFVHHRPSAADLRDPLPLGLRVPRSVPMCRRRVP